MSRIISKTQKWLLVSLMFMSAMITSPILSAEDDIAPTVTYLKLEPDFVVNNVSDDERLRYIKTTISIRTDDVKKQIIEDNMPVIRDALVMFLSGLKVSEVTGAIAREKSRVGAAEAVNLAMKEETGTSPKLDILFSSFVTQ